MFKTHQPVFTMLFLMALILMPFSIPAQDDVLTLTDGHGKGVLSFGDDEPQDGSGGSDYFGEELNNHSITVFTDLVADPGSAVMGSVIGENLDVEFSKTPDPDGNVLIANYPYYFVRANGCSMLITMSNRPRQFTEDEVAWLYSNPVVQESLESHKAYVHIEMLQAPYGYDMRESFKVLGRLAASFTPVPDRMPEGMFIRGYVSFSMKDVAIFTSDALIDQLLGDNPMEIFQQEISIRKPAAGNRRNSFPAARPELPANRMLQSVAMKTSLKSFNTFRRLENSRDKDTDYRVQAILRDTTSDLTEVVWLDVLNVSGSTIEGRVIAFPSTLKDYVRNSVVKIPDSDMVNWLVSDGENEQFGVDPDIRIILEPNL